MKGSCEICTHTPIHTHTATHSHLPECLHLYLERLLTPYCALYLPWLSAKMEASWVTRFIVRQVFFSWQQLPHPNFQHDNHQPPTTNGNHTEQHRQTGILNSAVLLTGAGQAWLLVSCLCLHHPNHTQCQYHLAHLCHHCHPRLCLQLYPSCGWQSCAAHSMLLWSSWPFLDSLHPETASFGNALSVSQWLVQQYSGWRNELCWNFFASWWVSHHPRMVSTGRTLLDMPHLQGYGILVKTMWSTWPPLGTHNAESLKTCASWAFPGWPTSMELMIISSNTVSCKDDMHSIYLHWRWTDK